MESRFFPIMEFPLSLLELLLAPDISDEVEVKDVAKEALPITLMDIITPTLEKLRAKRESCLTDIKRVDHIEFLDRNIRELATAAKSSEAEGCFVPAYRYIPPSLKVYRRTAFPFIDYEDIPPKLQHLLKVRSAHILPISTLQKNLREYEDKLVITEGILIGHGHESYDIAEESYSYTTYVRSFILEDQKTGYTLEIGCNPNKYADKHPEQPVGTRKIVLVNDEPHAQEVNFSTISAYLDASITKSNPVVIGGIVHRGKFYGDMFVTNIGNEKQVFTYVIDIRYGIK